MALELQQLAACLQLDYRGDGATMIRCVGSLGGATAGDISFLVHRRYLAELADSKCTAVILPTDLADRVGERPCLLSPNPHFHFVRAIEELGLVEKPEAFMQREAERVPVIAEPLGDAEKEAVWARLVENITNYAAYKERTDRNIRVYRLRPR